MIKNVLSSIGGIGIYGVLSICIFFAVFLGSLVWAFRLKRTYVETMRVLPLDDEREPRACADQLNSEVNHE
jgi:hypothetical protein